LQSTEELSNSTELMRTNKKMSNKNMPQKKKNKNGKKVFQKNNNQKQ